jgi:lipid A 3-O-deacylase
MYTSCSLPNRTTAVLSCLIPVLAALLLVGAARAETPPLPTGSTLCAGAALHDRGPLSDRHEHGVDLNLEVEFPPFSAGWWQTIGAPRPHVGTTLNFAGATSVVYTGATYLWGIGERGFVAAALGLALHDGPLHKDDERCDEKSDCGFGIRVLPRIGLEGGVRLGDRWAASLFYDHLSHAGLLASENEGIDHMGLRFRRGF